MRRPTVAIEKLGFRRITDQTFLFEKGNGKIEHFLYLHISQSSAPEISIDFGFRSDQAYRFSSFCLRNFGGRLGAALGDVSAYACTMRFPLGRIAGWGPRYCIGMPVEQQDAAIDTVISAIEAKFIPIAEELPDNESLLRVTLEDEFPFEWMFVNSAARFAELAFLEQVVHGDISAILDRRERLISLIASGLLIDKSPGKFFDEVVHELGRGAWY